MPVDPSIIQTQQKLPDFAGAVNSLIGLRQRALQNAALQQQIAANQASSGAIQKYTDATGNVNIPGVLSALASNPNAAYNLPQIATQLYQMQGAQYNAQNSKLSAVQKQIGYWDSQLGGLVAKGNNLTKDDIIKSLAGGMANNMISPEQAQQYAQEVPDDPAQLQSWAKNHWISLQDSKQQFQELAPTIQTLNTGATTNIVKIDPLTGKPEVAGTILNTMTPGEAATPVPGVSPNGTPYAITKGRFAAMQVGQPGTLSGEYTGRYPGSTQPANELPAGALQTGLSPSEQAAQTAGAATAATGAANAAQTLHNAAADVPMRVNLLQQARDALEGSGTGEPLDTGPGAAWRNTAQSFVNSLAPGLAKELGYTGKIQNFDEFKKILTNYASSVSGSLGTGTDARLNAAVTGNANPDISRLANEDILVKTIAAEKMRAAQDYAFQNSGVPPQKFNQWQAQWNKSVDPDAFAFVEMNPSQQQEFIQRESKTGDLAQFKANLGKLVRAGIIQMPGQ